jgi:hydrogenase maturation factor
MDNNSKGTRKYIPIGKLPHRLLNSLLQKAPLFDSRVITTPGIGMDCSIINMGSSMLVYKSDPITFATDEIGWYAVQVNINDIATTGAFPRWMLMVLLLPNEKTDSKLVEEIFQQVYDACNKYHISLIGGHTEITHNLDRPILIATMIGEVQPGKMVAPSLVTPGDQLLLTKSAPIEATAILAREFSEDLYNPSRKNNFLTQSELLQAQDFIHTPGISVLQDAQIALLAGTVHAMHDPTEGGIRTAIWEMAWSTGISILIKPENIPIYPIALKICEHFDIDPLGSIASGSLLLAVSKEDAPAICDALKQNGINCSKIGSFLQNQEIKSPDLSKSSKFILENISKNLSNQNFKKQYPPLVWVQTNSRYELLDYPLRDEIAKLFE